MSDTQTTPTPAEYVPQHVLANEENEDATKPLAPLPEATPATPEAELAETPEPEPEQESEEKRRRREAARIGYLTKQRFAERARAEAAEARLQAIERQLAEQSGQQRQPTQQDYEAELNRRAEAIVQRQRQNDRFASWEAEGVKELGVSQEEFRDASETLAQMVDPQRAPALVEVLLDTPGGQRAVMHLAGNAEEAERILAMPPHKMALAIAKLGAPPEAPKPKPVSAVPAPIRPPAARSAAAPNPEHGDMASFLRWSATQEWKR